MFDKIYSNMNIIARHFEKKNITTLGCIMFGVAQKVLSRLA